MRAGGLAARVARHAGSVPMWTACVACAVAAFVAALGLLARRWSASARRRRAEAFLRGKHVWVTGGSSGLGLAIAAAAARCGARVTVSARSAARLRSAAAAVGAAAVEVDVGDRNPDTLRAAFARVEAANGPVDVAIANAGVNHGGRPFDMLTDEDMDTVVSTNLLGTARTFARALPGMLERRSGVLCAVSSLAGYRGVPGASVYGATKAAVTVLCQSLNVELLGSGVSVVCAHPGFVATPAIAELHHPKPFLMTSQDAADTIVDAIVDGRRHVGLPWMMENVVLRVSKLMPSPLYEHILDTTGEHHAIRQRAKAL